MERSRTPTTTRLILVTLLVSLLGCATQGAPARPTDFPFHAAEQPLISLHWRLHREDGAVMAVGLVEVAAPDRISEVTLELQVIDKTGRVVSRAFDRARPTTFLGNDPWPFTVRLRARGEEDRVTLRVSDVTWKMMRGGS